MSATERKLQKGPSNAKIDALISNKWPKAEMCHRYLDVILSPSQKEKLVQEAKKAHAEELKKPVPRKAWSDLRGAYSETKAKDFMTPDPDLIDKTVYEKEFGGDMVIGRYTIVGGYRFKLDSFDGLKLIVEKLEKTEKGDKVVSKTVPLKQGLSQIADGEKTITIGIYGQREYFIFEGIYIKVE